MKKMIILLLSIFCTINILVAQPGSSLLWTKQPNYSDEFNDTILDLSKWVPLDMGYNDYWSNTVYRSGNIKTGQKASDNSGSVMQIITNFKKDSATFSLSSTSLKSSCTSGMIYLRNPITKTTGSLLDPVTNQSVAMEIPKLLQYGYYEIRSRLPSSRRNVSCSFWLWDGLCPEPYNKYNEIDIYELNANVPFNFSHSVHDNPDSCSYECAYNFVNHVDSTIFTHIDFSKS